VEGPHRKGGSPKSSAIIEERAEISWMFCSVETRSSAVSEEGSNLLSREKVERVGGCIRWGAKKKNQKGRGDRETRTVSICNKQKRK